MPVDTDTRLIPPAAARARIESLADHPATKPSPRPRLPEPTLVIEDAKVLPRVVQSPRVGRHRKPDVPLPDEAPTGPLRRVADVGPQPEAWLPGEGPTRQIPVVTDAPVPLPPREVPTREAGVALHSAGDAGLLASVLGAAHRLRGKLLRGDR